MEPVTTFVLDDPDSFHHESLDLWRKTEQQIKRKQEGWWVSGIKTGSLIPRSSSVWRWEGEHRQPSSLCPQKRISFTGYSRSMNNTPLSCRDTWHCLVLVGVRGQKGLYAFRFFNFVDKDSYFVQLQSWSLKKTQKQTNIRLLFSTHTYRIFIKTKNYPLNPFIFILE